MFTSKDCAAYCFLGLSDLRCHRDDPALLLRLVRCVLPLQRVGVSSSTRQVSECLVYRVLAALELCVARARASGHKCVCTCVCLRACACARAIGGRKTKTRAKMASRMRKDEEGEKDDEQDEQDKDETCTSAVSSP